MKLKNFLNVMNPTRTYKVICGGTVAEFEPDETLPDIIASDELVKKQIEVYESNNKEIREMKERKINLKVLKWWLYFGK